MICKYKILAHNESGYIVMCNNCDHFQIAFGILIISVTREQFTDFKTEVQHEVQLYEKDGFPDRKTIQLPTFSSHVYMAVSFNELKKLAGLIADANVMTEMNRMIRELQKGTHANDKVKNRYGYNE